jgi:hypothetical protein
MVYLTKSTKSNINLLNNSMTLFFLRKGLGSSSVKISVFDNDKNITAASVTAPEFAILSWNRLLKV